MGHCMGTPDTAVSCRLATPPCDACSTCACGQACTRLPACTAHSIGIRQGMHGVQDGTALPHHSTEASARHCGSGMDLHAPARAGSPCKAHVTCGHGVQSRRDNNNHHSHDQQGVSAAGERIYCCRQRCSSSHDVDCAMCRGKWEGGAARDGTIMHQRRLSIAP
jgi:hypothetical protein